MSSKVESLPLADFLIHHILKGSTKKFSALYEEWAMSEPQLAVLKAKSKSRIGGE